LWPRRGRRVAAVRNGMEWAAHNLQGRLPERRDFFDAERAALSATRTARRVEHAACESVELGGDVGVAGERKRHAGVERRRHGLVVARELVMNRMAERVLDLLRRDHVRLDGAVEKNPHALAGDAELPHA